MATINFPTSPTNGQIFTDGDHTWVFSSIGSGGPGAWNLQTQTVTGPTGPTGATGPSVTGPTGATGTSGAQLTVVNLTANYTFASGDEGDLITMDNASARTFTVPPESTFNFAVGTQFNVLRLGTGSVTIVAGAGVTIRSALGLVLRVQYSSATIAKIGTNLWFVTGDTSV